MKIVRRGAPQPRRKPSEESHYEGMEPVRGLPARLPPGETMLWQGEPDWRALAVRMFHVRKIAIYFAALLVWDIASTVMDGESLLDQAPSLAQLLGLALVAIGLIVGFCYAVSRTTVYTVTTRRVVIRAGIAVPKTINIPFARIASAGVKLDAAAGEATTGNVLLTPMSDDKIAYLLLWPHTQAWQLAHARPMLRSVRNAAAVARILGDALAAQGEGMAMPSQPQRSASRATATGHAPAAA